MSPVRTLHHPFRWMGWQVFRGSRGWLGPEGRWHSTCISHHPTACQRSDAGMSCAGVARCSHAAGSARLGSMAELTSMVWQEELLRGCPQPGHPNLLSPGRSPQGLGCFSGRGRMGSCSVPWHGDSLVSLLICVPSSAPQGLWGCGVSRWGSWGHLWGLGWGIMPCGFGTRKKLVPGAVPCPEGQSGPGGLW